MLRPGASVAFALVGGLACIVLAAGCGIIGPNTSDRSAARSQITQIAYVASDDHIYIAEADGSNPRQVTRQVGGLSTAQGWSYRWPTYSPDGKRLAFAGYRQGPSQLGSGAVLISDVGQANPTAVLESAEMATIYLYWSPNSRYLAALLQRGQDLVLYLFDANGTDRPRELLVGQPLYWSWAPDGNTLAVHVGGSANSDPEAWIGLLHLGAGDPQQERFDDPPGVFRSPAWSPTGNRLAYASLGGGTSILTVRDSTGKVNRVAAGASDLAFNWSPNGDWIAFAYGEPDRPGLYAGVEVAHADGSDRRTLSQDPVVAFFWSPDATRLAVVGLDTAARQLTWTTLGIDGKTKHALSSFLPSTDFGFELPFFDQYAQSTSVWSADSKRIVYSAQSSGSEQAERLLVMDADGATPAAAVADGGVGVWSPPTASP